MRARLLAGLATTAALGLALRSAGCAVTPQPMLPQQADVGTCAGCHEDIAREWRGSGHAGAWSNPAFVAQTQDHAQVGCLGCHAPASLIDGGPIRVRDWRREDGVDCQACHLDASGRLVGPHDPERPTLLQGHLVRKDAIFYRSNELCGTCHVETLAEVEVFNRAPERHGLTPTCQQCHMQPVVRDVTQGGGAATELGAAASDERRLRRHDFALVLSPPGDEQLALELRLEPEGDQLVAHAAVENGLPHAVPSGGAFCLVEVELELVAHDAAGQPLERLAARFVAPGHANGDRRALPAGGSHALPPSALPPGTARVTLRLLRRRPDHDDVVLAERSLAPGE